LKPGNEHVSHRHANLRLLQHPNAFRVDFRKIGLRINTDCRSQREQFIEDRSDQIGMAPTKISIDMRTYCAARDGAGALGYVGVISMLSPTQVKSQPLDVWPKSASIGF
jgi:hypothetical protein